MVEPVIDFMERLVTDFSWRKLILVAFILAFSFGSVALYENYTAHFELNKLERTVNLIEKISEVEAIISDNEELKTLLSETSVKLGGVISPNKIRLKVSEEEFKFLWGLLPWVLLSVLVFIKEKVKSKGEKINNFFGLILLTMPFSVLNYFVPSYENIYINYFLIPWGIFMFPISLIVIFHFRAKTKSINKTVPL